MCGIQGWAGWSGAAPPLQLDRLRHRGPDDQGQQVYSSRSQRVTAVLGSTRLAIIDLSSAGHMPMEYPGEPLAIVFNGEIYNFQELRRELEARGERFFSRTDTEVILRGYRVWGDEVVKRLHGMFAFALWDGRGDGRLLLARDRFGKKPLYVRPETGKGIRFASELKALLIAGDPREIDAESLAYYLDRGYPPPDRCMLRGFQKILPGQLLIWEAGQLQEHRFWSLPEVNPSFKTCSAGELSREMRERLTEAVRKRLVADVPIGLLLSGGVDSSSILALMARFFPNPVATYTACFGAANLDESEAARRTALQFGARHHAIMISPRAGRLLPFIASHLDEPIADPSAIATYLICRRARQDVTVLLTGDGSDELLLGYPRYRLHAASHLMSRFLPDGLRRLAGRFLPSWSILERSLSAPGDPFLRDRYWLDHGRRRIGAFSPADHRISKEDAVSQVLKEDVRTWLVEDILMKVDKMSMAASVEIRVPFLDQDLAAWMISLPVGVRMSWGQGKKILYDAMRNLVPRHISWKNKQPFHLPVEDWLRSEWRIIAQDVLLDKTTLHRGWVDEQGVRQILAEHLAGEAGHGRRLYQLLALELWARSILDKGAAEPVPVSIEDCIRELDPARPVRRVAVIAPAGIGDTMRLTPALRQLGESDPNVSVTLYVAAGRGTDEVMAGARPVDRQVTIDFHGRAASKIRKLIGDVRNNPPEQLVSTWVSRCSGLVHLFCGVKRQSGWAPPWSAWMQMNKVFCHKTASCDPSQKDSGRNHALAFSKMLGVNPLQTVAPYFAPPIWEERGLSSTIKRISELPGPILAVNGVAQPSIRQREYPLDMLADALKELLHHRIVGTVVLLGDDYARSCYRPLTALGPDVINLSGDLSLTAAGKVMQRCDAVLSIDGGLLHVALASKLPVLALYGPTEVYSTDPRAEPGRFVKLSAYRDCRCLCETHRSIRVQPECREQARCLASIPATGIVESIATLLAGNQIERSPRQLARKVALP